jgi:hypothetical protein
MKVEFLILRLEDIHFCGLKKLTGAFFSPVGLLSREEEAFFLPIQAKHLLQ